jgi:tetratricopeptide (TPR) repeat protein
MRRVADEAIALARRLNDDSTLVRVFTRVEAAISAPDTLTERLILTEQAVAAANRTGDPVLRWYAAVMSPAAALESGDVETFRASLDVVVRLARDIGQPFMRWESAFARALREQLAGDLGRAEELAAEALEIGVSNGQPDAFMAYAGLIFEIRATQGRLDELVEFAEQSAAANAESPGRRFGLALCYCELDRIDEARQLLGADVVPELRAIPFDVTWKPLVTMGARVVAALGDRSAAAVLCELLEPWRDQIANSGTTIWSGAIAHPLGLALATTDRFDEAEDAFAQAAAIHEHIGAPILLAGTRLEWARLLCRRDEHDDRSRACELANAAHTAAVDLGAGSIARHTHELLDQLKGSCSNHEVKPLDASVLEGARSRHSHREVAQVDKRPAPADSDDLSAGSETTSDPV